MRIELLTWDGTSINNANYESTQAIGVGNGMPPATPNFIDMGQGDPVLGGKTLAGALFTFRIRLLSETDDGREALHDAINAMFRPNDFTLRQLVGRDIDDANKQWYLEGYPVSYPTLELDSLDYYTVTLALTVPYWQAILENTTSFNIGSSTEDNEVDPGGNLPTLPRITITPGSAKGSPINANRFFVGVYHPPVSQAGYGYPGMPIDLTPSGLDTAALVTAGKMRSDGNDLKVLVDGIETPRFFGGGGINTTTTHIWATLSMPSFLSMTLQTTLDNTTTPSSITIRTPYSSMPFQISGAKTSGDLLIGSEIISFTSMVVENDNLSYSPPTGWTVIFSGLTRGNKETTKAAHAINDAVYRIYLDIWIVYGDPSASAPPASSDRKPGFSLSLSSNDEWIYDDSFATAFPFSSFSAIPQMQGPGTLYVKAGNTGLENNISDIPWTVLGMKLKSKQVSGIPYSDTTSRPSWWCSCYAQIDTVVYEGRRKRSGVESGALTLGYMDQNNNTIFTTTISTPPSVDTWAAFSGTLDFSTYQARAFVIRFSGGLGTTLPLPEALAELSYVKLVTKNTPVVFIPSTTQGQSYELSGYIENVENNHRIAFKNIPMLTGDTLTIDCENMTASISDGRNARTYLDFLGAVRDEWMVLLDGSNTIRFYDLNTTDVDISVITRPRNTI